MRAELRAAAGVQHADGRCADRRLAAGEHDHHRLVDDRRRGQAVGLLYGSAQLFGSVLGQLVALFTGLTDGWRYGMWTISACCVLAGLAVAVLFRDPGVGAAEKQLADLDDRHRVRTTVSPRTVLSLFRIPTFSLMMVSRLLSGHLLVPIFGVQFLVVERGFSNAVAATVLVPFGLGYFAGTVGSGWLVRLVDRLAPRRGRVGCLQAVQVLFAATAFLATQFSYPGIGVYCVFWALLGALQGMNPPINRPVVAAVVLPELRGHAFAIFVTVFETIAWALFSLGAGHFAASLGVQTVFLWTLVALMLVNGVLLTALHATYPRDAQRVETELSRRRDEALGVR
ncbi:MFS transporter [Saccharopolyspora rosea]|uniref:MFS transporter n=1 Tax=Saccharopolyspora rosea TaxID=524884 RepID=A0ABW3FTB7_9PSEU